MDKKLKRELEMQAIRIRMDVIKGTFNAKSGHPGGSLSISDIMAYLYFHKMNVDPQNPDWEDRDRFVLSKGHTAPALYGALALKGFFPESEIERLRKPTSYLQGHPSLRLTPGVDMSTGSLGQGISAAVGMALAAKLKNKDYQVYTILGDGEIQEGQVWEAAMFAAAKKLDNLGVQSVYARFKYCFFTLFFDGDVKISLYFFNCFFNSCRVNSAVRNQFFKS